MHRSAKILHKTLTTLKFNFNIVCWKLKKNSYECEQGRISSFLDFIISKIIMKIIGSEI